jgi:hypothetical protein
MKHNLSGWARGVLRALSDVVMPRGPDFQLDLHDHALDFIDQYVGYFPPHLKYAFPLGLLLLEFGPVIYMRRLRRFSRMSLEDRERYVASWAESSSAARRDLIKGVKALIMVAFYSHPLVMEYIGYDIESHIAAALAREY